MKFFSLFFILLLFKNELPAQVTNVKAGLWSNPSTWSNNTVPADTTDVTLNYDVIIDANASCNSLNTNGHAVTVNTGIVFNTGSIPDCILQKINEIKSQDVRNPPGSIWRYEYNSKTVYFIPSYCCDFYSDLLDKDCTLLCNPDGGIAGSGDGNCPDFISKRKNGKLIWQDDRK